MIELQDDSTREDFEDDNVNALVDEYTPPRMKYYKSHKVLGELYRAIDEHEFLLQLQSQTQMSPGPQSKSIVESVWKYVEEKTKLIQWSHWYQFALDTRDRSVTPQTPYTSSPSPPIDC